MLKLNLANHVHLKVAIKMVRVAVCLCMSVCVSVSASVCLHVARGVDLLFLLLARYAPNVAKRSI